MSLEVPGQNLYQLMRFGRCAFTFFPFLFFKENSSYYFNKKSCSGLTSIQPVVNLQDVRNLCVGYQPVERNRRAGGLLWNFPWRRSVFVVTLLLLLTLAVYAFVIVQVYTTITFLNILWAVTMPVSRANQYNNICYAPLAFTSEFA